MIVWYTQFYVQNTKASDFPKSPQAGQIQREYVRNEVEKSCWAIRENPLSRSL